MTCPKIAVVARRSIRKNKFIDYVAEFHLELIARFNAFPVIIPRVANVESLLRAVLPSIDGLLIVEGEDLSTDFHVANPHLFLSSSVFHCVPSDEVAQQVKAAHASDTNIDASKDSIESRVLQFCLTRGVPILAICRGSQLLNVVCGGTLHTDLDSCASTTPFIKHVDYQAYDTYRHPLSIVPHTPLARWFDNKSSISVSSYHHQGVATLAPRFKPMAFAPDGLIEAFYDPNPSHPFITGLQFHPERMQLIDNALADKPPVFEYEGCVYPYRDFVNAARQFALAQRPSPQRTVTVRKPLSSDQVNRLIHAGATVRGGKTVRRLLDKKATRTITVGNENENENGTGENEPMASVVNQMRHLY